jgi:hypothetical protein
MTTSTDGTNGTKSETVTLRTGIEIPRRPALVYWTEIKAIHRESAFAISEALQIARNPGHRIAGETRTYLTDRAFLDQDGNMPDLIRAIVLSAVDGRDLFDISLVAPFDGAV